MLKLTLLILLDVLCYSKEIELPFKFTDFNEISKTDILLIIERIKTSIL